MKTFYIYAIPETLVSLVRTGQMPDNALNKTIDLYQEATTCAKFSPYVVQSTFLIELVIPEDSYTYPLNFTFVYQHNLPEKIQTQQIKISWITNIYTYNKTGRDIAMKYFNISETPVDIVIRQEFFPKYKEPICYDNSYTTKGETEIMTARFIKEGDLLGSQMQTLVNTVNCVGVMGKGIAKIFKDRFPQMFEDYKVRCKAGQVVLGKPYLFKTHNKWIVNFPTKQHWRNSSHIEDVEQGLKYLVQHIKAWGITSIAIPPLGCGNGGLDWKLVEPLILKYFNNADIPVEIYTPFNNFKKEVLPKKRKAEISSDSQAELTKFFRSPKEKGSSSISIDTVPKKRATLTHK